MSKQTASIGEPRFKLLSDSHPKPTFAERLWDLNDSILSSLRFFFVELLPEMGVVMINPGNSFQTLLANISEDLRGRRNVRFRSFQVASITCAPIGALLALVGVVTGNEVWVIAGLDFASYALMSSVGFMAQSRISDRRNEVSNGAPKKVSSLYGFQQEILPHIFNHRGDSLLVYVSETIIEALKPSEEHREFRASADDVVNFANHVFTGQNLNQNLVEKLDSEMIADACRHVHTLLLMKLDSHLDPENNFTPITEPNLIQILSYAHLIGSLQRAMRLDSGYGDYNLPGVNLTDLIQKYNQFYDRFVAYCQRKDGEKGRRFAADELRPLLNNFATTGEEFTFEKLIYSYSETNPRSSNN